MLETSVCLAYLSAGDGQGHLSSVWLSPLVSREIPSDPHSAASAQKKARQGLHGRRFGKGTVRASFFSEARYLSKDFQ